MSPRTTRRLLSVTTSCWLPSLILQARCPPQLHDQSLSPVQSASSTLQYSRNLSSLQIKLQVNWRNIYFLSRGRALNFCSTSFQIQFLLCLRGSFTIKKCIPFVTWLQFSLFGVSGIKCFFNIKSKIHIKVQPKK